MPNQPFVGGIDILPGNQGPPIPANGFRLVTIGGAPYYTTDGVTFTAVASDALATPATAGLMSVAQVLALAGLQPSKVAGAVQYVYSDVIDLTQVATYAVLAPTAVRIMEIEAVWEIKTTNTATVSPTYSIGSNSASFDNIASSQSTTALHTGAAESLAFVATTANNAVDVTTGITLNVTVGATATALTARLVLVYTTVPV